MTDLAQFSALAALIIGGFGLFAFMLTRLERRLDTDMRELRRDMAEEFRAQRAEVGVQVSAIANAILAAKS